MIAIFASLTADTIWFQLGRIKGIKVLQLLCKISLEPDSCVRRTEGIFAKEGARSLLLAKFLPGLGAVAPPLAGIFHMRFAAIHAVRLPRVPALWAGTFLGLATSSANKSSASPITRRRWVAGLLVIAHRRIGRLHRLQILQPPAIHPRAARFPHHGGRTEVENRSRAKTW